MKVKLNKSQFSLLLSYKEIQDLIRYNRVQITHENRVIVILFLEIDTADLIRDFVIEELQKSGFDANYELTECGKILEELSDIFFT